jgi:hypothetical protein
MTRFRRTVLACGLLSAVTLLAAACGGGNSDEQLGPTIASLAEGQTQVSLLAAQSSLVTTSDSSLDTSSDEFSFGLVTKQGGLLAGGSPEVWVARDRTSEALGPFRATPFQFSAYEKLGDQSPQSPLTSFYVAAVSIPQPGKWIVAASIEGEPGGFGTAIMTVVPSNQAVFPIGSEAKSTPTPVAKSEAKAREICTRKPEPDPLHYISLDEALKNGKPTVVSFATPLLCESRICGPVVDEVWAAYDRVGQDKANFIHLEEFLPGPDLQAPTAEFENQSAAFRAWGLVTEPWTFVIDVDGIIRARFEGPVVSSQIVAALQPLL